MTGETSRFPITRLAAKVNEARNDPELVALREPLSIVAARQLQLLERIEENDSPERWEILLKLWSDFKNVRGDEIEFIAFIKLDNAFKAVYHDYKSWEQVMELMETRRKLSESERKRLIQMKQMISSEDAYGVVAQIHAAIIKVLHDDPGKLKALQFELVRIVGDEPGERPGPSGTEKYIPGPGGLDTEGILDTRIEGSYRSGAISTEVSEGGAE